MPRSSCAIFGYDVALSHDAKSALHTIENAAEPFDLVLTDVVMPGAMSGFELARTLARTHPTLPVVLTTGYSDVLVDKDSNEFELRRQRIRVAAQALFRSGARIIDSAFVEFAFARVA